MKQIQLSQGLTAQVDDDDFERLTALGKWCASRQGKMKKFYAIRWDYSSTKRRKLWMHREVARCPQGMFVHHEDGNGLNNCKANLRIVTFEENARLAALKTNGSEEPSL